MGKCVKDKIQCQGSDFPKQPAGQSADSTLIFFNIGTLMQNDNVYLHKAKKNIFDLFISIY